MIDDLTGLANRAAILQAIDRAIAVTRRGGPTVSLLYIDLDGFRRLNDRCGHDAGDAALREVASALSATARGTDTVGRIGGDDFVVVLSGPRAAAEAVARRGRERIVLRLAAQGWLMNVSIGVATFEAPPCSAEAALAEADAALSVVKRQTKPPNTRWTTSAGCKGG